MPLAVLRPNDVARVIDVEGHWGQDPNAQMPPNSANAVAIVPNANYGYDAASNLWLPVAVSGSGAIVEQFSQLIANLLATLNDTAESTDDSAGALVGQLGSLLALINTRYGANQTPYLWNSMLNSLNAIGFRKILNVDAGTYAAVAAGATTISYTGVNLAGTGIPTGITAGVVWNTTDRTLHGIVSVTNPAGANPGVITLDRPINTASAVLYVPYASLPHAYNSAADATQTLAVVGDPPRINGPATFLSIAGAAVVNGTYQYVLPCALYGREQLEVRWSTTGTTLFQFRSYGKINNAIAWPVPAGGPPTVSTMLPGTCIDHLWQYGTGSLAFGSAPVGGTATNVISARLQDPHGYDSVAIEMVIANQSAVSTVTAFVRLTGGTA